MTSTESIYVEFGVSAVQLTTEMFRSPAVEMFMPWYQGVLSPRKFLQWVLHGQCGWYSPPSCCYMLYGFTRQQNKNVHRSGIPLISSVVAISPDKTRCLKVGDAITQCATLDTFHTRENSKLWKMTPSQCQRRSWLSEAGSRKKHKLLKELNCNYPKEQPGREIWNLHFFHKQWFFQLRLT